jgi:flagellar hook-length control protein FliK
VPSVASEATTPAYKPALPNPAWAAPSSGRPSDSPFDALLDDSTRAAAQAAAQPPQSPPPPSDKSPPSAQSNSDQATARDPAKAPPKAADASTDQPGDNATAPASDTAKASQDCKTGDQTATGDDSKPAGTGKKADAVTPANPAVTAATNAIQTSISATVIAPVVGAQDAPATVLQAVAASGPLSIAGADTTKAKSAGGTAKTDAAKLTADTNASAQNANGKTQTVAIDADKQPDATQSGKNHTEAAPAQPASTLDAQGSAPKVDGSALQQAALSVQTPDASQTTAAPPASAPQGTQALAVPLNGVAIEIAGKASEGSNHFEIRLDPPDLGRIEVRLDVDKDGNTTTHMIADRSDTLNLLRNDSSDLQRALQDAGLKTSDNGLQFSLRDQSMGQQQSNAPTPGAAQIVVNDDKLAASETTPRSYPRLAGMGGGIDIRV